MNINICDWCGVVTVDAEPCRCPAPCDARLVSRRHREAVLRARRSIDERLARDRRPQRAA